MSDQTSIRLNTGARMPVVGFGTWQLSGREAYDAVRWALEAGYRHIDTATMYRNEAEIGRALRDSDVPRDQVFVTTKLPPQDAGKERRTLERSLDALGVDALDLWLIHWPPDEGGRGSVGIRTWEAFVGLAEEGLARAIGVSNYSPAQVDELIQATGVTPAVNQVKWSPFVWDRQQLEHSRDREVALEGYSPFKAGRLDHPVLAEVAERHDVTPAQVVMRWHVEHQVVVIPKSANRDRIATNLDVFGFSLSPEEVVAIDALRDRSDRTHPPA